jgi:hypothetical protein
MSSGLSRRNGRYAIISGLNAAIQMLNIAKETSSIVPAGIAFGSASTSLMLIRVCFL